VLCLPLFDLEPVKLEVLVIDPPPPPLLARNNLRARKQVFPAGYARARYRIGGMAIMRELGCIRVAHR